MSINPLNTHFPHATQFKAIENQRSGSELSALEKEMQDLCRRIIKGTISDAAEIQSAREKMSTMVKQLGGYRNLSSETQKLWSDQVLKPRGTTAPTIRDTFNKRDTALKSPIETPEELARKLNKARENQQPNPIEDLRALNALVEEDIDPNLLNKDPVEDPVERAKQLIQALKKIDVD